MKVFQKIPTKKPKPLSQDRKHQLLLAVIGSECHTKKGKNLPPLRENNLNKKVEEKNDKIKRNLQTANRNWND